MSGFLIYPFEAIYPKVSLKVRILVFAKEVRIIFLTTIPVATNDRPWQCAARCCICFFLLAKFEFLFVLFSFSKLSY